jgi:hypothetical protein
MEWGHAEVEAHYDEQHYQVQQQQQYTQASEWVAAGPATFTGQEGADDGGHMSESDDESGAVQALIHLAGASSKGGLSLKAASLAAPQEHIPAGAMAAAVLIPSGLPNDLSTLGPQGDLAADASMTPDMACYQAPPLGTYHLQQGAPAVHLGMMPYSMLPGFGLDLMIPAQQQLQHLAQLQQIQLHGLHAQLEQVQRDQLQLHVQQLLAMHGGDLAPCMPMLPSASGTCAWRAAQ